MNERAVVYGIKGQWWRCDCRQLKCFLYKRIPGYHHFYLAIDKKTEFVKLYKDVRFYDRADEILASFVASSSQVERIGYFSFHLINTQLSQ